MSNTSKKGKRIENTTEVLAKGHCLLRSSKALSNTRWFQNARLFSTWSIVNLPKIWKCQPSSSAYRSLNYTPYHYTQSAPVRSSVNISCNSETSQRTALKLDYSLQFYFHVIDLFSSSPEMFYTKGSMEQVSFSFSWNLVQTGLCRKKSWCRSLCKSEAN